MFFFNDTATTEIYTLSLHDALPIFGPADRDQDRAEDLLAGDPPVVGDVGEDGRHGEVALGQRALVRRQAADHQAGVGSVQDRKSTRLNSSHANISYAVFCLKKKTEK